MSQCIQTPLVRVVCILEEIGVQEVLSAFTVFNSIRQFTKQEGIDINQGRWYHPECCSAVSVNIFILQLGWHNRNSAVYSVNIVSIGICMGLLLTL